MFIIALQSCNIKTDSINRTVKNFHGIQVKIELHRKLTPLVHPLYQNLNDTCSIICGTKLFKGSKQYYKQAQSHNGSNVRSKCHILNFQDAGLN